jgi:molybdate transport system substrate-binding protein
MHHVAAAEKVLLYAAASTSSAITEIISQFQQVSPEIKVQVSFASSSTLAKQIEAGAPAQLYMSANPEWMDYLQARGVIINASRQNLLSNKIVLITPKGMSMVVEMNKEFDFAGKLQGKLCLGDPAHVPAGIYAKQALIALGWWQQLKFNVVGTKDVRAALAFVERGECAAGIVYASDADISKQVELIAEFPSDRHRSIVYPVAMVVPATEAAGTFLNYLSSPAAMVIFKKYGFSSQ